MSRRARTAVARLPRRVRRTSPVYARNAATWLRGLVRRAPHAHFLHIGKTAGTAVTYTLGPYACSGTYALSFHRHDVTLLDLPANDFFFFVVRDPIARFVSGFYSRQRQGRPRYDVPWREGERIAFERYSTPSALSEALASSDSRELGAAEAAMRSIGHVRTSYWDWFGDEETFLARVDRLLFIGFHERLQEDFPILLARLGLDRALRLATDDTHAHRNPASVDRSLTPLAVEKLMAWYSRDYDFLKLCRDVASSLGSRA